MQYSKCGLTIAGYNGLINVFSIYVMFLLVSASIWLPMVLTVVMNSRSLLTIKIDLKVQYCF